MAKLGRMASRERGGVFVVARMSEATSGRREPRISRSLSSGAHSRDPLAHAGYKRRHRLSFSRHTLPEVFQIVRALFKQRAHATLKRGRREDRVRAAPAVSCAKQIAKRT